MGFSFLREAAPSAVLMTTIALCFSQDNACLAVGSLELMTHMQLPASCFRKYMSFIGSSGKMRSINLKYTYSETGPAPAWRFLEENAEWAG